MHDTAFQIGCRAIDTYSNVSTANILEIGSYDVNGSLRNHVGSDTKYVGLDFEAGPGVDIVVTPGTAFPVEDDHFDLVIASSALEHDPAFWNTFLEMCRKAKRGGYIYINVPSNGVVHRYPQDCWRFYPDSGRALAAWARSQGQEIKLVESFIANRQNDIWNDFVAVFHKAGAYEKAPSHFLYQQFPSANVLTDDVGEPIHSVAETEDMLLSAGARAEAEELRGALAETQEQAAVLSRQLDTAREQIAENRHEIAQISGQAESLQNKLAEANAWASRLAEERRAAEAETGRIGQALVEAEKARNSAIEAQRSIEKTLQIYDEDNANLIAQLDDAQKRLSILHDRADKLEWLQKVNALLMVSSGWWGFMPPAFRRKRELRRLAQQGLFDADRYYDLHSDVRAEGMDPLRHYILHGISEGREI